MRWAAVGIALFLFCAAVGEAGQPPDTLAGFKPNNVLENRGIDHVNPFSGDPGVIVALGPEYPLSAGHTWQLRAHYSPKFWHFDRSCSADLSGSTRHAVVSGYPTLGAGWTLELGYLNFAGYHSPDSGLHTFSSVQTIDGSHLRATSISGGYKIEFPDGTVQTFTQAYQAPIPVSGNSRDFNDVDWDDYASQGFRYGLTSIRDSFGTLILTVDYIGSTWRVSQINLNPGTPQARSITYTWGTQQVGTVQSVTWNVLTSISFPTANGSLTAAFAFDIPGGSGDSPVFQRNIYDNSFVAGYCVTPGPVFVPLLDTMTLSGAGVAAMSYQFRYLLPHTDPTSPFQGALKRIVLPTQGVIQYAYNSTTGTTCFSFGSGCPDPETDVPGGSGPSLPLDPGQEDFTRLWDDSAGVISRTETDPTTGLSSTVTYSRYQHIPQLADLVTPDEPRITRRTIVTEPSGNGAAQFATRYVFHVEVNPFFQGSGIELERRYYADANPGGTPTRTLINCHEADNAGPVCGHKDTSGNIQPYTFTANTRRQKDVTWYGINPTSGGDCSQSTTLCSQAVNSVYNPTAGEYGATTASSTIAGSPTRSTTTNWTPQTGPWLLKLYNRRTTIEGSSTVDRYAYFNTSNGFLNGSSLWQQLTFDPPAGRLFLTCQYPNSPNDGTVLYQVSLVIPEGYPQPTTSPCSFFPGISSFTSIGDSQDLFARRFNYQSGLTLNSKWLVNSAPTEAGWYAFNVARDNATGLITSSSDTAGQPTSYSYDALGRVTLINPPGGEASTVISYDTTTQTTVTRNGGGLSTWQRYLYDGFGRPIREIRQMPAGSPSAYALRLTRYDNAGHAYFVSEWAGCSDPASCATAAVSAGTTSSSFDPFGRPQTITRADATTTTISYTDGSVSFSDTQKAITVNNLCIGGTGCPGGTSATTTYRYDAFGRVVLVTEPTGDQTSYSYDANDKLTLVYQPPSQLRTFAYDPAGNLRTETTPEKGTVNYQSYGSLGNLFCSNDQANNLGTRYDYAGRVIQAGTISGGSCPSWDLHTWNQLYLGNTYDELFHGSSLGRLTTRVGYNPLSPGQPSVTESFYYFGLGGRLSQKDRTVSGTPLPLGTITESWGYNLLGLLDNHSLPKRAGDPDVTASWSYSNGLPVGLSVGAQTLLSGATYHPYGGIASWTAGNGVATTIQTDSSLLPRPSRIFASSFDTGVYSYDGAGNIKQIGSDIFGYDALSRLASSTVSGQGLGYAYDRYGNLNPSTVSASTNRLTAGTYDARGNLTEYGGQRYDYDALSRQTAYNGGFERYIYDGAGERIARITSPSSGADFYTVTPCRLFDTRVTPPSLSPGSPRVLQVSGNCGVAAEVTAVTGNLTVTNVASQGYLNLFPTGTNPPTSTLSYRAGITRANNFNLGLSGNGQLTLTSTTAADGIVDVSGYYAYPAPTWTLTLRDEGNSLSTEYSVTSSTITRTKNYFHFGNLLVATRDSGGSYAYYHSDHLGTPRLVTGALSETHTYHPFGQEITPLFGNQPLKFAAMERDQSSGNDSDHARVCATSTLGRFLSPDKLQGKIFDPQSWNRYAYARNNPLKYLDPNGQDIRIAVAFASDSNVARRDQIAIARSIGNTFVRAGVKNVSVFLDGNQVLGTGFDARAHKMGKNASTSLTVSGKNEQLDRAGLLGGTPLFSSKSDVSLTKINEANLGLTERNAAIANVGAHETGHGSGGLNLYNFDATKDKGGQPGSVMETLVEPGEIALPRDFSRQDQRFLQQCLNEGNCGIERFFRLDRTPL